MRNCDRIARRALELVRSGWCQGAAARTHTDAPCEIDSPLAVQWDLLGGCERAAELVIAEPHERGRALGHVIEAVVDVLVERWRTGVDRYAAPNDRAKVNIATWNDAPGRKPSDAADVLRAAVEALARKSTAAA